MSVKCEARRFAIAASSDRRVTHTMRGRRLGSGHADVDQTASRIASALLTSNPPGASTPRWVTTPFSATKA